MYINTLNLTLEKQWNIRTKGRRIRCRGTELNRVYISRQKTTLFKGSFVMCSFAVVMMLDRVLLDRVLLDRVLLDRVLLDGVLLDRVLIG